MSDEGPRERRQLSVRDISAMVILVLNFGALVWGAATMSSTVRELTTAVRVLNTTTVTMATDIKNIQIEYNARLRVLEDWKLNGGYKQ